MIIDLIYVKSWNSKNLPLNIYFVFLKSLLVYSLLRADNMYMQDPIKWFVKLILAKAFHSTIQCYAS